MRVFQRENECEITGTDNWRGGEARVGRLRSVYSQLFLLLKSDDSTHLCNLLTWVKSEGVRYVDEKERWKKKHTDKSLGHDYTEEWPIFFKKEDFPAPSPAMLDRKRQKTLSCQRWRPVERRRRQQRGGEVACASRSLSRTKCNQLVFRVSSPCL